MTIRRGEKNEERARNIFAIVDHSNTFLYNHNNDELSLTICAVTSTSVYGSITAA